MDSSCWSVARCPVVVEGRRSRGDAVVPRGNWIIARRRTGDDDGQTACVRTRAHELLNLSCDALGRSAKTQIVRTLLLGRLAELSEGRSAAART